ncbi:MAG: stage II sporulation protein M [Clostridia bacterium]
MWTRFRYRAFQHIKENLLIYMIILFTFTVGVATGAYTVSAMPDEQKNDLVQYMNGFIQVLSQDNLDIGHIFRQSLLNNFQTVALSTALGLTIMGVPFILLIIGIRGFFIGFTVGFLVGDFGWKGFMIVLFGILPQNILIIPTVFLVGVMAINHGVMKFKQRKTPRSAEERMRLLIPYLSIMSILFLILIAGTVIESLLIPSFLKLISGLLK